MMNVLKTCHVSRPDGVNANEECTAHCNTQREICVNVVVPGTGGHLTLKSICVPKSKTAMRQLGIRRGAMTVVKVSLYYLQTSTDAKLSPAQRERCAS